MLKRKLFQLIRQHNKLIEERSRLEDDSDFPIPKLFETDDEYAGLCIQVMELQEEVDKLLIDAKYTPLDGLDDEEFKELDYFAKSAELSFSQNIEEHISFRMLTLKEEMKKRLEKVKILRLPAVFVVTRAYIIFTMK